MDREAECHATQERVKSLIQALDAMHPDEPHDNSAQDTTPGTLLLAVGIAELSRRLRYATRSVSKRRFPAVGGYFTLQQARGPRPADHSKGESTLLTMRGLFHEQEGGVVFFDRLIVITLTPVSGQRTAVQVECKQPELDGYYRKLVSTIEGE
ncbi:MAG: hypothetical protein IVW55_06710 [Chloroflexi bacterium]|nr:hypothetical protein [Chloroflexota bacterium]